MASILTKRHPKTDDVFPETLFALLGITPRNKYEDGKKTQEILGYVYQSANTATFDIINVFVEGVKKPLMTNEELVAIQEAGNHVYVEFDNARIRPYYSNLTKQIEDSIKADGVHIVETE